MSETKAERLRPSGKGVVSMNTKTNRTQRLVMLALLTAVAYLCVFFIRIPLIGFLKYEPKDVIITIGAFLFGPVAGIVVSVVSSLLELVTISETGWIGLLMNVLSTVCFVCPAAIVYKRRHTLGGAVAGLLIGVALMTGIMLLWNYLITPLYLGTTREAVVDMLLPVFLPFNLIKGALNAALTLLLYKPVVTGLRKAHLVPESREAHGTGRRLSVGVLIGAVVAIATCVLLVLVNKGVI